MNPRRPRSAAPASPSGPAAGRRRLGSDQRTVTPLYHQMYLVLRQKIRDREFAPDQPLPGEHQLAAQFGVSRVTVRRTLENLELEGLVVRRRGIGTFPVPQPVEHRDRYNIGGLVDAASVPAGTPTENQTLSAGLQPAPVTVAAQFGLEGGTPLYRIQRRRSFRGEPFTILTAWASPAIGPELATLADRHRGIPVALEKMDLALGRAEQAITARAADEQAAALLAVPVGAPLLAMATLVTDRQDQPVVWMESLFRPDRYEYRSTMLRRRGAGGERWRFVT